MHCEGLSPISLPFPFLSISLVQKAVRLRGSRRQWNWEGAEGSEVKRKTLAIQLWELWVKGREVNLFSYGNAIRQIASNLARKNHGTWWDSRVTNAYAYAYCTYEYITHMSDAFVSFRFVSFFGLLLSITQCMYPDNLSCVNLWWYLRYVHTFEDCKHRPEDCLSYNI